MENMRRRTTKNKRQRQLEINVRQVNNCTLKFIALACQMSHTKWKIESTSIQRNFPCTHTRTPARTLTQNNSFTNRHYIHIFRQPIAFIIIILGIRRHKQQRECGREMCTNRSEKSKNPTREKSL